MRVRFLRPPFLLSLLALLLQFTALEMGASIWLRYIADDAILARYGTLEQNAQRQSKNTVTERSHKARLTFTPHRYIGYIPTPGFRRGKNYHNALGFRGGEFPLQKPDGIFRIVCLGGSTTYTNFVDDPAMAYPAQLDRYLRDRGFVRVRVINAGAPGWTSHESLSNFIYRVIDLEPNLVLYYHGINDTFARLVHPPEAYKSDNSGYLLESTAAPEPSLMERSNILRILGIRTGRAASPMALHQTTGRLAPTSRVLQFIHQVSTENYPSGFFVKNPVSRILAENPPGYFLRNTEHIAMLSERQGARFVPLTFKINPSIIDPSSHSEIRASVADQNEKLVQLAENRGLRYFDFARAFPDDPALYADSVHVNEAGARLKAERIGDFLIEHRLIPR